MNKFGSKFGTECKGNTVNTAEIKNHKLGDLTDNLLRFQGSGGLVVPRHVINSYEIYLKYPKYINIVYI